MSVFNVLTKNKSQLHISYLVLELRLLNLEYNLHYTLGYRLNLPHQNWKILPAKLYAVLNNDSNSFCIQQ